MNNSQVNVDLINTEFNKIFFLPRMHFLQSIYKFHKSIKINIYKNKIKLKINHVSVDIEHSF